jgi:hypothetical protein
MAPAVMARTTPEMAAGENFENARNREPDLTNT